MKRTPVIALFAAVLGATLAATAGALLAGNEPAAAPEKVVAGGRAVPSPGPQPDTTSSNWKYLSNDVGLLLRHDDRLGARGRLYVRIEGAWQPVAIDGLADVGGAIPVK